MLNKIILLHLSSFIVRHLNVIGHMVFHHFRLFEAVIVGDIVVLWLQYSQVSKFLEDVNCLTSVMMQLFAMLRYGWLEQLNFACVLQTLNSRFLYYRNLCHTVSSSTRFVQKLLSCNLAMLFTESERDSLMGRISVKKSTVPLETSIAFPPPGELHCCCLVELPP
jgi:hypothetical protein